MSSILSDLTLAGVSEELVERVAAEIEMGRQAIRHLEAIRERKRAGNRERQQRHRSRVSHALVTRDSGVKKENRVRQKSETETLFTEIAGLWNAWAVRHGSPQVNHITNRRASCCRRRLEDIKDEFEIEDPLEAFRRLLTICDQSFFVTEAARNPLKFDQLMREDFLIKLMENNYKFNPKANEGNGKWRGK